MEKYIPKFEYKVVACHGYTEEKLVEQHDEMSLIMLINRIQTPEDFHNFQKTPKDYVEEVVKDAPEDIRKIMGDVLWALLMKIGIPMEEAKEAVENMEAGQVGYLFENIEKMDIQEERRKTKEALEWVEVAENQRDAQKSRAEVAENRAEVAENRAEVAEKQRDAEKNRADMLTTIIQVVKEEKQKNHTKEQTLELLKSQYHLEEAEVWVEKIW